MDKDKSIYLDILFVTCYYQNKHTFYTHLNLGIKTVDMF